MRSPREWYEGLGALGRRVVLGGIAAVEWVLATEFVDQLFHFAVWFNWFQILTAVLVAVFVPPFVADR